MRKDGEGMQDVSLEIVTVTTPIKETYKKRRTHKGQKRKRHIESILKPDAKTEDKGRPTYTSKLHKLKPLDIGPPTGVIWEYFQRYLKRPNSRTSTIIASSCSMNKDFFETFTTPEEWLQYEVSNSLIE